MRLKFLQRLDACLRRWRWIVLAPLLGYLVSLTICAIAFAPHSIPLESYLYGISGAAVGTLLATGVVWIIKKNLHPWVLHELGRIDDNRPEHNQPTRSNSP